MIKQIFSIILLVYFGTNCNSQSKVMLHFKEGCHEIKELDYTFFILNDSDYAFENMHNYNKQDTLISIKPGLYHIEISIVDSKNEDLIKSFHLTKEYKKNEVYKDTIRFPDIIRKITRVLHYPTDLGFFNCDTICNGEVIEYYENGNIKSKGIYKNGRPIKKIFHFNNKGELVETKIYNKNGYYKKSKYNN